MTASIRATAPRSLGRSGLSVTAVGLGTASLGGLFTPVPAGEATAVVQAALHEGLNLIDTAPLYGHTIAERRLGAALAGVDRCSFVLSTKVGWSVVERPDGGTGIFADAPPAEVVHDFSADGVRRSLDGSLQRLGVDSVDVVLIHDPDDHEDEALAVTYPVLHDWREQGVVKAIGVGMNQSRILTRFVRETDIDCVLVAGRWTLLDRSAGRDLLPACAERGVAVLIGGVYNSGLLADPRPGAAYDYAPAQAPLVERAQALGRLCAEHGVPLKAAALQFPFRHPAVTSVLTGARSTAELVENLALLDVVVPEPLWDALAALPPGGVQRPPPRDRREVSDP